MSSIKLEAQFTVLVQNEVFFIMVSLGSRIEELEASKSRVEGLGKLS